MARPLAFLLTSLAFGIAGVACGQHGQRSETPGPAPSTTANAAGSASVSPPAPSTAAAALDGGPYEGPWLGATVLQAPIMSEMEWPGDKHPDADGHSVRLGYMRYGERAAVVPEAHKKANCPDGWYELVSGGFVCAKYATLDMDHPRFKLAKPPDLDGPLPYIYGVNVVNGTPLYKSVPSRAERIRFEPWLAGRRRVKVVPVDDNPYATAPDAGTSGMLASAGIGENAGISSAVPDAGAEVPWWEIQSPDGGPPPITLEDLQGESGGPMARRMVKGFYLSLDHQFDAAGTSWWKTVGNMSVPYDRIVIQKPVTDFHGVWLGKDDGTFATKDVPSRRIDKLPVGFVLHMT
jgi:hypothetical protein